MPPRSFRPRRTLAASSPWASIWWPFPAARRWAARRPRASALLQQLDMDVAPETWTPPKLIDRANLRGVPHHGIGRGFKAGKEEIVGLLTALDRFVKADDGKTNAALEARLKAIEATLDGLDVKLVPASV